MATAQVELGDAAAILPGYAVKARVEHEPDGRFQLIQGKHLTPGDPYRFKPADRLRITGSRNAQAYQVHAGDILLASRGPSNYIVPIESVPEPTIAPATFYIVRPDLHTDGRYLAWLLQQPLLQAAMARMRGGTGTPILQREQLMRAPIPLPPLDHQRRIAELAALMQRERALLRRLDAATLRKHQAIGSALIEGPLAAADTEATPA
jgi:hypothetical protein